MTEPTENVAAVSLEELRRRLQIAQAFERQQLARYTPYPKQASFHAASATHAERMLSGGNQCGKSWCGGAEAAMHATGLYPEWWEGRRFDKPTRGWVAGISNEQTRDNAQRVLFGPEEAQGTGMIPEEHILDYTWSRGIANFLDTMIVRHVPTGGKSHINFKSYEQGRKKFQGPTLDWEWLDEEPPEDVYAECLARITKNRKNAVIWITFTPLLGRTSVVNHFYPQPDSPDRHLTLLALEDALHIPEDQRERIALGYPEHEREARAKGIPTLGHGRVFPLLESLVACDPQPIPEWWRRIIGLDFGWDHPTAAVWMALNPDSGTLYVTDCYKQRLQTPVVHADAIKFRSDWAIPVAWPKDGLDERTSGLSLAVQYAEKGLRMIPTHAQTPDKGTAVEPTVMKMLDAMKTGKLKVFRTCTDWFDEFRQYHRKDGVIVKEYDDLMSATRYAFMMLRYAASRPEDMTIPQNVGMDYDPLQ